ncbi:MAG: PP2C family serine/threonine-protein phosphatase [Pirellulales bacterium]
MAKSLGDGQSAVEHAALTDVGLRRANNQDTYAVALAGDETDWRRRGHLFMVADGMGAHAAGELASQMACESVPHTYRKQLDRPPADALKSAIVAANATIHERGQAHAEFQGMGTTCSVLVLLPRAAIVAHVGDSRVYRLRGGKIEQLTFDHSLVWEMTAAGQMPRGEVASFIPKNIITRSLGPRADVQIDLEGPHELAPDDVFLMCSDGLSGQVKDEEMGAILATLSPAEAVRALVDMANLRGGPDNVTAIVVKVLQVPDDHDGSSATTVAATDMPSAPIAQFLWVLMALGLLLALLLAASGNMPAALASGLLAAGAAVVALIVNLLKSSPPAPADVAGPLGSGPHATHSGAPDAARVAELCQMAQQLREAAKDEHWTLDWAKFNTFGEHAQAALVAGDFGRAVREYALAISYMMNEIRHQPSRKDPRDSSVLDL